MNHRHLQSGFTVVETLITVFVAAIFILSINILYGAITKSSAADRSRAEASDIAYAKLRKYVYAGATPPSGLSCSEIDLTATPPGAGHSLESGNLDGTQTTAEQPVSYNVRIYAPYGCSGSASGTPLMITATVTFGPSKQVVSHSDYVGYQ